MRQHHAFRFAGCARGVNDRRQILGRGLRCRGDRHGQVRAVQARVLFLRVAKASVPRRRYSLRIEKNDVLNFRTLAERVLQFNKLFTIFEKENA